MAQIIKIPVPPKANPSEPQKEERLLTAPQVRRFFGGISHMTLWAWTKDAKLAFPKPTIIRRKRFWSEREILAFYDRQKKANVQNPAVAKKVKAA